jgi:hypothetical protein
MSDYISCEEIERKLSLVVRKPQEGKTTICITHITNDASNNIHIVITMNTLTSSSQFIGRMLDIGPKKIIVFNSDKKTAGECWYANSVDGVMKLIIKQDIKVIVCCANVKKIREKIPDILDFACNDNRIKSKNIHFIIHIDEAHKYIPENIPSIRQFNENPIVSDIIGYTATPDGIWSGSSDPLFYKILIRDVKTELSIMHSDEYYGVKDCQCHFFEEQNHAELALCIPPLILPHILKRSGMKEEFVKREWYGDSWHFDLGNERLMLGFLTFVLPTLSIDMNCFSYHFAPAFNCKVTHYQCVDIILTAYPTANVIVLNGNGYELFRTRSEKSVICNSCDMIQQRTKAMQNEFDREKELNLLKEPSYMIQKLIEDTPNFPTFVTGFQCVGMSVTLVNQVIGNFDTVIMSHEHYSRDKLYQLCRFLFNYKTWMPEHKLNIKRTQFYSLTRKVVKTCLDYEQHIDRITEFAGKTCSLREIQGLAPEEQCVEEIEKEKYKVEFNAIELKKEKEGGKMWKKFKVYDGNDESEWEKANQFYESILGKRILGKSMPTKVDGFYHCTTQEIGLQMATSFNALSNEKWSNRFKLKKDILSYARVFVGYENIEYDPPEYTIFIKFIELVDTPSTRAFLKKYDSKKET